MVPPAGTVDAPEPAILYAMSCGVWDGAGVGANVAYDGSLEGATLRRKLAEGSTDDIGAVDGTAVSCKVGN